MLLFAPIHMKHQQHEILSFLPSGNNKNYISVYFYFKISCLIKDHDPRLRALNEVMRYWIVEPEFTCFKLKFVISLILNKQSSPVFLSPFSRYSRTSQRLQQTTCVKQPCRAAQIQCSQTISLDRHQINTDVSVSRHRVK